MSGIGLQPRKRGPRTAPGVNRGAALNRQLIIKVAPLRVMALNQFELPRAPPFLEPLFAQWRRVEKRSAFRRLSCPLGARAERVPRRNARWNARPGRQAVPAVFRPTLSPTTDRYEKSAPSGSLLVPRPRRSRVEPSWSGTVSRIYRGGRRARLFSATGNNSDRSGFPL